MARRLFVRPLPPPGPATLSPRLGHHLGRIVRLAAGDAVVLFDGAGGEVRAAVRAVGTRELQVDVGAPCEPPLGRSPRLAVHVACAMPRKAHADWLLAHGTEAGVASFRPLLTERARRAPEPIAHWRRVLIEACAQCDRATLPALEPAATLAELCAGPLPAARFVAATAPLELGPSDASEALLVVGPEGGLTAAELELLAAAGFAARSLGPLTLRTETAVVAGAVRLLQAPPSGAAR
ncbi:MAG: 16S rRNA (uracil(1498)-N(3))-methyltransferase [Planctomycetes bacterium]|nr:16S rRNA (uracil(1498)-N(3))-methyltransferase [Planctomycetota bacterium]